MPYGHPAIKELVHILVFSRDASKQPYASQDMDAFDPIPLPLLAYVCTAVCEIQIMFGEFLQTFAPSLQLLHGLEEYKFGRYKKLDFSELGYKNWYNTILENLEFMEENEVAFLNDIREDIFETGW